MNVLASSRNKVIVAIVGVIVLLALVAGTSLLVVSNANNHNLAVQRAAATALHNREVASAVKAKAAKLAKDQAAAIASANAKAAKAERAANAAGKAALAAANEPPVVVQVPGPASPAGLTGCGTGVNGEEVYAGADTSCPFALNVEAAYAQSGAWYQTGTSQFYVSSPVTGEAYLMTSSSVGDPVVVTGGNNALVEFNF